MALTQRLEIRQSQSLVMTPQLMQAIKLLQLSSLDLAAYVENELERNPLLEREGAGDGLDPEPEPVAPDDGEIRVSDWVQEDLETSREAIEQRMGTDLDNVFDSDIAPTKAREEPIQPSGLTDWSGVGTGANENGDYNLEAFVSGE